MSSVFKRLTQWMHRDKALLPRLGQGDIAPVQSRPDQLLPVRYTVPSRFDARFPPPDRERPGDAADLVSFAMEWVTVIGATIAVTVATAVLVIVPVVRFFAAT